MTDDIDSHSDRQLPHKLEESLVNLPPLPKLFQSEIDVWRIEWQQTPRQLNALFNDEMQERMRDGRYRSTVEPVSRVHFRDEVDVEQGVVEVLLETLEDAASQSLTPNVLIDFEPHDANHPEPSLMAYLACGTYECTKRVTDDEVEFDPIPTSFVTKDGQGFFFKLFTVQ